MWLLCMLLINFLEGLGWQLPTGVVWDGSRLGLLRHDLVFLIWLVCKCK
jgi:hypothetical protein